MLKINRKLSLNGFSLIELMVAVVILAMVIFGIFLAFSTGFQGMADARERTVATNIAQKIMEDIKNNNAIKDNYPSETISGKIYNIVPEKDEADDLITVTVTWQDRKENEKSIKLEMVLYDLGISEPDVEVGIIELISDPISSELICCNTTNIIATVKDTNGNFVPNGVAISFSVTNGTGELSPHIVPTVNGIAQVTLTLIDQSSVTISASSGEISGTIDISCMSPTLAVEAEPTSLAVCEDSTITATLTDNNFEPIIGKSVEFNTDFDGTLSSSSADTNDSGEATVTLTSKTATITSVNATYCGITRTTDSIHFNTPNFSVVAEPTSLAACETSTITATLKDNDEPIIGKIVEFSTNFGDLSNSSAITNESGEATLTLTSDTVGTAVVDATYCGVAETDTIYFNTPNISVEADPPTITPGSTSAITATLTDGDENLVADGTEVSFRILSGKGGLSADSAPTTNGQATVILTADTESTTTIEVEATYCGFNDSVDITILQQEYSFTLSPSEGEIEAGTPCTITATLTDNEIPLEGEIINFSKEEEFGTFSNLNNPTNADGQATVELTFSGDEEGKTAIIEGVTTSLSPNINATTTVTCIAVSQKSDFKVIHGNSVIPSGSSILTLTNGNDDDYTLEPGVTAEDCFVRIVNTRLTGIGKTDGGGNQSLMDFTVQISNPGNIINSFNFERVGSTNNCRVTWEIIQYIGAEGGKNEIKVRTAVGGLSLSSTKIKKNGDSLSNISNINKAVIYITGQSGSNTGSGEWNECLFTAEFIAQGSKKWKPSFTRGRAKDTGRVSYAVVEFTGSNWRDIQRVPFDSCNSTVNLLAPLFDVTKTFLHCQYTYVKNANVGLDDAGETVEVLSTTQLTSRRRTSATDASLKHHVVWVIENTQSTGKYMIVQHVSGTRTDNNQPEEHVWSETINEVRALDEASIQGETLASAGTGTAYPRGSEGLIITSTTNLDRIQSDMGQDCDYAHCIVQFPTEE